MGNEERPLLVPCGVELSVAVSSLIKYLRRGLEADALWWAKQIESRFHLYLWRRLSVFATEDVGLGDPNAIVVVQALRSAYLQAKDESRSPRPDASFVAFAVLYLARCAKNREADDLHNAVCHLSDSAWESPVPQIALDLHTTAGRERMPDAQDRLRHWLNEASRVVPEVGPLDWKLFIRRWAALRRALPPDDVLQEAQEWDDRHRLVWGADGYPGAEVPGPGQKEGE